MARASAIRPRYVALTLRTTTGTIAWGIQNRPFWLVEFPGARYEPAANPDSECACDRTFQPPNTDVAIDAQTGALVVDYGMADPAARQIPYSHPLNSSPGPLSSCRRPV